jgi:hypothetical protein
MPHGAGEAEGWDRECDSPAVTAWPVTHHQGVRRPGLQRIERQAEDGRGRALDAVLKGQHEIVHVSRPGLAP